MHLHAQNFFEVMWKKQLHWIFELFDSPATVLESGLLIFIFYYLSNLKIQWFQVRSELCFHTQNFSLSEIKDSDSKTFLTLFPLKKILCCVPQQNYMLFVRLLVAQTTGLQVYRIYMMIACCKFGVKKFQKYEIYVVYQMCTIHVKNICNLWRTYMFRRMI